MFAMATEPDLKFEGYVQISQVMMILNPFVIHGTANGSNSPSALRSPTATKLSSCSLTVAIATTEFRQANVFIKHQAMLALDAQRRLELSSGRNNQISHKLPRVGGQTAVIINQTRIAST